MKDKKRYFPAESTLWTVFYICVAAACIAGLFVFWNYKNYAAFAFLFLMFAAVINEALSFVKLSGEKLSLFSGGKEKESIAVDSIRRMDTQAGKTEKLVIYGEGGTISVAYKKKTAKAILDALDVSKEMAEAFFGEGEDTRLDLPKGKVIRESVMIDRLLGKKRFVHRQIELPAHEKNKESEENGEKGDIS